MTFTHLAILLAIGALHSASLWLVTLGAKRVVPASVVPWIPICAGVPTAYLAFPLALRIVTGVELTDVNDLTLCALLGIPAAVGAEAVYRIASSLVPRIADKLIGRLGDDS
jgi:hypothetical protein